MESCSWKCICVYNVYMLCLCVTMAENRRRRRLFWVDLREVELLLFVQCGQAYAVSKVALIADSSRFRLECLLSVTHKSVIIFGYTQCTMRIYMSKTLNKQQCHVEQLCDWFWIKLGFSYIAFSLAAFRYQFNILVMLCVCMPMLFIETISIQFKSRWPLEQLNRENTSLRSLLLSNHRLINPHLIPL